MPKTKKTLTAKQKKVLASLKNDIYARPSVTKYGVGVKAFRSIPKGVDPYKLCLKKCWDKQISIPYDKLKADKKTKTYLLDFFIVDDDGMITLNENGPNMMNISMFMNHSNTPNVVALDPKKCFTKFKTLRRIKAGEELTIDYRMYEFNQEDLDVIKKTYK